MKKIMKINAITASLLFIMSTAQAQLLNAPKDAEPATIAKNAETARHLPPADPQIDADIAHGFIGSIPDAATIGAQGNVVYTLKGYEFLQAEKAPATVNPSLWIQARKGMGNGLYKVTDGFYQVRGIDLTNMTIVEGKTGIIIIDAMLSTETARSALNLYYSHRPKKPIVAILYNHSHVDHYGGVKGLVSEEDVKSGKVQIIAPTGFMEHAISENVLAGNAMSRRAEYQFGTSLPRSDRGQLDIGGAKALSKGTITLIEPTRYVTQAVEKMVIDGVEIINMLTPGTEAPAEMIHFFPQFKVLDTGELACQTQHQLLTLRGASIRDAQAWSNYLNQALARFGDDTTMLVGQHTWPVIGHTRVINYLSKQRDMYKWLNDQSLRLINLGYKPVEVAEFMSKNVPASLANEWETQGYYGSVQRNAKAVYQEYIGWYDGNPANLDALSDADYGRKFVAYGGGAEAILKRAHADYVQGEYRWVAQAMSHLVFADPSNQEARNLGADALEQLGYQAQSAVERNAYLYGAMELRNGKKTPVAGELRTDSADTVKALSIDNIFDYLGVRLNAPKAEGKHIVINWNFSDGDAAGKNDLHYVLNLENSALTYLVGKQSTTADATLTLSRATLDAILLQKLSPKQAIATGLIKIDGNPQAFGMLLSLMDTFSPTFNIVTPNPVLP
ncbi:alkyl/aryl-sulfatase [Solimicrobium silvestre]|uniref:Alkyl sulfatase and related hydrolase n=1 Tax=Solimicrobium silvestre TaxID=2099400 RepID=A0A2S9GTU9_9BURK|nr:alkyl sulfatase dimerization domain-containing protein [Solimicrobium silvestre]PRC91133.1 Alkyl sulfatase and related hydrolase [Solimicrobium silvestre]